MRKMRKRDGRKGQKIFMMKRFAEWNQFEEISDSTLSSVTRTVFKMSYMVSSDA